MQDSSPTSRLQQQGTHALLTAGVSVTLGLILSIVVARTLGPSGKGTLDVVSASAALFTLVLGGSLNVALTHHVAGRGAMPAGITRRLALWSAGAAALCWGALAFWPEGAQRLGFTPDGNHFFWVSIITLLVGFGVWSAGLRGVLIGRHALITANRIDVAIKALLLAGYGVLALLALARPSTFAWVAVGTAVLLTAALAWALRGPKESAPSPWPTLLGIALPVHGNNIVQFLNQRADVFFVQAFHGAGEVGIYALAVSLAQIVLVLSSALAQPLLPQVSSAPSPQIAAAATADVCRQFITLGLLASVCLTLGGSALLSVVFGRDFSASLPLLLILLPGMIAFGLMNILTAFFVGIGRSRINLAISLLALAVTVAGNFTLTRSLGARGAAITTTIAYALGGVISLVLFVRRGGIPLRQAVVPLAADWRGAFFLVARFRP